MSSRITRCIRCFKSYHQLAYKQGQVDDNQCFLFDKLLPITADKCICKDHLDQEVDVLKAQNEIILPTSAIVSLHNQGKNTMQVVPTDHIIQDFTKTKDGLEIKGDLRVKGWAQEDVKQRELLKSTDVVSGYASTTYVEVRKNLNNFLSSTNSI